MSRRKKLLAAAVAALLLTNIAPLASMSVSEEPEAPSSTYGVNDKLAEIQDEKASRYDPPDILRETKAVLDAIQPRPAEKTPPVSDFSMVEPVLPDMSAPYIFGQAENNTALNGTSIIQWLIDQPLSYWVHTRMGAIDTWTKGILRPVLNFTVDTTGIHFIDWTPSVKIDADQNASTGEEHGYELEARFSIVIENYTFDRPTLIPPKPGWDFNFTGGLHLEVHRLTNTTAVLPIEVSFLKAFMYRGFDYIWISSFNFSNLPPGLPFDLRIVAEKVHAGGGIVDILGNIFQALQNFTLGNTSILKDISGPYKVEIHSSPLEAVTIIIGYAKAVNMVLVERSWILLGLTSAAGRTALPANMELWLDSPSFNVSFNRARWTADGPCHLQAVLAQSQENFTFGRMEISELPSYFYVQIDNNITNGQPDNRVHFESSTPIPYLDYDEFELFGGNASRFRNLHVMLKDMPTELDLTGTFDVGGPQEAAINNPIGIGLIPVILDNLMTRFVSKFYTFARTLRNIPENALHMSEKAGWLKLEMPAGQKVGTLDIRLASGPYIVRQGSFLAFNNLSLADPAGGQLGVSFSMHLEGLSGLDTDFRSGVRLDIHTVAKQKFTAEFIDQNRGSNASVDIADLPGEFSIGVDNISRTLSISCSEKIDKMTYLGWVRQQYLKMSFSGLPSMFKVTQKADRFEMDTPASDPLGRLEILSTDSSLFTLDGNYLLVRSGSWGTSFGAAFEGLSHAGYSTGADGKLELCLTSPQPLRIFIENETALLKARMAVTPMPRSLSVGMSNLLTSGGLKVPDILRATSVLGFSSAVFAITELGADVLAIADQAAGFVDSQMEGMGTNSTFGISTDSDTVLVGDFQKGNITEAPWTHGITSRHIELPSKNTSYYNTKLYLRLARDTRISSRTSGDDMNFSLEMKGFRPKYDWMLIDMEGMSGRNIEAYLTGLATPVDFRLDVNLTQNATYGRDILAVNQTFHASKPFGPFMTSLARSAPLSTRVLVFAAGLPQDMQVSAYMAGSLMLRYNASDSLEYMYIKNSRLVKDRWRASTVLLHDIPASISIDLDPPAHYEASGGPVQMMPDFEVAAGHANLDVSVVLDGRATGQRASYQLEVKNAGKLTTGKHSGDSYRLRASGSDEVYIRVWDMPYRKGTTITALGIFAEDLRSLDLKITMVFGTYPMFQISSLSAESMHLNLRSRLTILGGEREGRLVFADSSSVLGLPMVMQFFTNGISVGASENGEHTLVPLPMASMLASLLGG